MPSIKITRPNGEIHTLLFDECDRTLVQSRRWTVKQQRSRYYAVAKIDGKVVRLHRLLMPGIEMIDHISRDGLDNRRENLRPTTPVENFYNSDQMDGVARSGHAGVVPHKGRWLAQVKRRGRATYVGLFDTIEEAVEARNIHITSA